MLNSKQWYKRNNNNALYTMLNPYSGDSACHTRHKLFMPKIHQRSHVTCLCPLFGCLVMQGRNYRLL